MRLGSYRLIRQIGAGTLGEVWIAQTEVTGRRRETVAVKRVPQRLVPDPGERRRLVDLAERTTALHHPNLVHAFAAGEDGGDLFVAMELVEGLDLAAVLELLAADRKRLPIDVSVYIVAELLRGLGYAHVQAGLVHAHVTPANVLLSLLGEVKLTDLGLARRAAQDHDSSRLASRGRYMPAEQLRGDAPSVACDLFAVGAILHELLDGAPLRSADGLERRALPERGVPPLRRAAQIPLEVELARAQLLDPDPDERPSSAAEALELLLRWPGYQPRPTAVAAEVERLRVRASERAAQRREPEAGDIGDLGDLDGALFPAESGSAGAQPTLDVADPDARLLERSDEERTRGDRPMTLYDDAPGEPDWADTADPDGNLGDFSTLEDLDQAVPRTAHERRRAPGSSPTSPDAHRPPSAEPGPGPAFHQRELDSTSLTLDLPDDEVVRRSSEARPAPARSRPDAPASAPAPARRRSPWPIVLAVAGVAALAAAVVLGPDLLSRQDPDAGTGLGANASLRAAKLASRGSLVDLGFLDPRFNRLVEDDIFFDYQAVAGRDPLAALAAGEVELARTSLDAYLRADRPGTIVAILGVTLASEALVVASHRQPRLRSLAELSALDDATLVVSPSTAAFAHQLDARLAGTLASTSTELSDDAAVLAALTRADSTAAAGVLREPFVGRAVAAGLTVAATGLDLPLATVELLVARDELLAQDPERVAAVVRSYYAATATLAADPAAARERAKQTHELSDEEAERALAGVCTFDAAAAARAFADPTLLRVAAGDPQLRVKVEPRFVEALAADQQGDGAEPAPARDLERCLAAAGRRGRATQALGELALPDAPLFTGDSVEPEPEPLAALVLTLRAFNPETVAAELIGYGEGPGRAGLALGWKRAEALAKALEDAGLELPLAIDDDDGDARPTARVRVVLRRAP